MRAGKTMDPNTMNNVGTTMGEAAFYGGIIAVVLGSMVSQCRATLTPEQANSVSLELIRSKPGVCRGLLSIHSPLCCTLMHTDAH
jgi:hypothetical protein